MRILSKFLIFAIAVGVILAGVAQAQVASHKLTVRPATDVFKVGSKVRLKVELENVSDHDLTITVIPWENNEIHPEIEGFRPVVVDANGKEPPLTKWGRLVFGRPDPSDNPNHLEFTMVTTSPLAPGKTYTSEIILSDLYDLSVPGTYTVHVPRFDEDLKVIVKSKATTITIVP